LNIGDIILFKPNSWIGRLIAKLTKSEYSHAAVIFDVVFGEPVLLEIDWTKSRLVTLSALERDYNVYGVAGMEDKSNQKSFQNNIITSNKYLNKGYDYLQLFSTARKIIFKTESILNIDDKYLCSEIIDRAYHDIGIDLVKKLAKGNAVPEDLAQSPLTFKKSQI